MGTGSLKKTKVRWTAHDKAAKNIDEHNNNGEEPRGDEPDKRTKQPQTSDPQKDKSTATSNRQ